MSLSVAIMIGIAVSYIMFSINGFNFIIVLGILIEADTNLILKLRHFEPTNYVFLENIKDKWDSKSCSEKLSIKYVLKSLYSSLE